jgi:hypothetical protein
MGAISRGWGQGLTAPKLRAAIEPGLPGEFRQAVLDRVGECYADFGPTLASEHLASDDGLPIHAESLRRWMREGRAVATTAETQAVSSAAGTKAALRRSSPVQSYS